MKKYLILLLILLNIHASYAQTVQTFPERVRPLFSSNATGLNYNSSTGIFSLSSGYLIPTTAQLASYLTVELEPAFAASVAKSITQIEINNWNDAYSKEHTHANKSVLDLLTDHSGNLYYNGSAIGSVQVNSDWNANSGVAQILNKPVLFSGNYNDLSNKPTIPTKTSQLTNDSGFLTSESEPAFNASAAKNITSGEVTVLSNTLGINTGDETQSSIISKLGYTPVPYSGATQSLNLGYWSILANNALFGNNVTAANYYGNGATLTGVVPYTGATQDVNLGNYNFTSGGQGEFGSLQVDSDATVNGYVIAEHLRIKWWNCF